MPTDKIYHFVAGYVIAATFHWAPMTAILCAAGVGALKELYDFLTNKYLGANHGVEFMDFLATAAGGVAGIGVPYGIKYFLEQVLTYVSQ